MDLGQDQNHGQRRDFTAPHWVDINSFHHSPHLSPSQEYGGFGFVHAAHSMNAEPVLHQMSPPLQPMQQLRPLVTPPWPSTLTSQSSYAPPLLTAIPTLATSPSAAPAHSTHSAPTPRRTLTDADRRRMCQYHEEHPNVKQTEIGAMFGVERSTVSKVLRNKEKYLFPEDGSRSPIKRSKGKFPDIERALSNWARNTQRSGQPVTDGMIKEKARFFANTVGSSDSYVKINNRSWLEKFKQKNNLSGAKSPKMAAETGEMESRLKSDSSALSDNASGISPISPKGVPSPSPISSTKSQENLKTESPDSYVDFSGYRLCNSQSVTSLSSVFTDTTPSTFSAGPTSPTSPFFPPDGACGPSPFLPSQQARLPPVSDSNYSRPRSQTFPALSADPSLANQGASTDNLTPRYGTQGGRGSPPSESPLSDMPPPPTSDQMCKDPPGNAPEEGSASPMQQGLHSHNNANHGMFVQVPGSPTQDDARRALEVLMAFFHHQPSGFVNPHEYMTMGKLMEKLRLQGQGLPGGLHQIPEQEELAPAARRVEQARGAGM